MKKGYSANALKAFAGVVFPIVLLCIDPFFFGGQDGDSLVGSASVGMYVLMFLSMTAFFVHLVRGSKGSLLSSFLSGGMLAGSLVSALLGVLMFPMSKMALRMFGIGLLGFYPFVVSILYFRSASSVWQVESLKPKWMTRSCSLSGFVLVLAIPCLVVFAANAEIDRLIVEARTGTGLQSVDWRKEEFLTWAGDKDRIVRAYRAELKMERRNDALNTLCFQLTGRTAEQRMDSISQSD